MEPQEIAGFDEVWRSLFEREPEAYTLANRVARKPGDSAEVEELRALLKKVLLDHPEEGAGDHALNYDYWLAHYPVTVAQFQLFVDATPDNEPEDSRPLDGPANTPVVSVSWTRRWPSATG